MWRMTTDYTPPRRGLPARSWRYLSRGGCANPLSGSPCRWRIKAWLKQEARLASRTVVPPAARQPACSTPGDPALGLSWPDSSRTGSTGDSGNGASAPDAGGCSKSGLRPSIHLRRLDFGLFRRDPVLGRHRHLSHPRSRRPHGRGRRFGGVYRSHASRRRTGESRLIRDPYKTPTRPPVASEGSDSRSCDLAFAWAVPTPSQRLRERE